MMERTASVLVCLLHGYLLPSATAQTYVVDAQNGPGSQFTTIAAAAQAVPDGATLVVRAGTYGGFQTTAKGVTILGEPGAVLDLTGSTVEITGLSQTQRFAMRGVEIANTTNNWFFSLLHNQGAVVLDFPLGPPASGEFRIAWCERVQMRGLTMQNTAAVALQIEYSAVALLECDLRCAVFDLAIDQKNGWLQLTDCYVEGGDAIWPYWNSLNAIAVTQQGRIEVRGCTIAGPPGYAAFAISGHGTAYVDNNTVLSNITALSSPTTANLQHLTATWSDMATCTASTGPLGTTATATANGPPGSVVLLFAGFSTRPAFLSGVEYPLWLELGSEATFGVGAGSVTRGYSVPNAPYLLGLGICWQALTYDAANGLQWSNASSYLHW